MLQYFSYNSFHFQILKKVTVWNIGEPNNYQYNRFQNGENCVEIIARPDQTGSFEEIGKLNDISCNKPMLGVICQIEGEIY